MSKANTVMSKAMVAVVALSTAVMAADVGTLTEPSVILPGMELTITYDATGSNLQGASAVYVPHQWNGGPDWQDGPAMQNIGTDLWQYTFYTSVWDSTLVLVFKDNDDDYDYNSPDHVINFSNWISDSYAKAIGSNGSVTLYAGKIGDRLYVASQDATGGKDRFLFVADTPGTLTASPWAKSGSVAQWAAYLADEADDGYIGWYDAVSATKRNEGGYMEGVLDIGDEFGSVPSSLAAAVGEFGTDGAGVLDSSSQVGASLDSDGDLDADEYVTFDVCVIDANNPCSDCNNNLIDDASEINASTDCNNNGTLDECEALADCDTNGTPDICQAGYSDCDTNGVMDTCDIADGGDDCNLNGILDSCDIESGSSQDNDGDDIPDECDSDLVLTLTPDETIYGAGESMVVSVVLTGADTNNDVYAGQFALEYDDTLLSNPVIAAGSSPFSTLLLSNVNGSELFIAVMSNQSQTGHDEATAITLATITFDVIASECSSADAVSFREAAIPNNTKLTVAPGAPRFPTLADLGSVVFDVEDPSMTCPDATVAVDTASDADSCSEPLTLTTPVGSDNCDTAVDVTFSRSDLLTESDEYPVDTDVVVTWTATDDAGNTFECQQTIVVTDRTNPVITECPADVSVGTDAGVCSATLDLTTPTATDNCAVTATTATIGGTDYTTFTGITFPEGVTTITWTVEDAQGNTATCSQDVTVTDDDAPDFTCPASTALSTELDEAYATVTVAELGAYTVSDPCDGDVTVVARYDGTELPVDLAPGMYDINWTATDDEGNVASCTQSITVGDNQVPNLTCPAAISIVEDPGLGVATVEQSELGTPIFSDNYDLGGNTPVASYNLSPLPQQFPVGGPYIITWTLQDSVGNSNTCTQELTVTQDALPPVITCPGDVTVDTDAGHDYATIALATIGTATAVDTNDPNPTITWTRSDSAANLDDVFYIGTTTITWRATDADGNYDECTQTIIVNDNEDPAITCPANIENVSNDTGFCDAAVTLTEPTASDNSGSVTVTPAASGIDFTDWQTADVVFPVGTTTITWTATDPYGNTDTCTQDVEVEDQENPTAPAPADIAACYPSVADAETAAIASVTAVAADNCGLGTITAATVGTCSATVTVTVPDSHGNSITVDFSTRIDPDAPVMDTACPADIVVAADAGFDTAVISWTEPTATDTCSGSITPVMTRSDLEDEMSDPFPQGDTTVTYTFTDECGNQESCSFTVTVTNVNEVNVTIELEGPITSVSGVDRCVHFEFYDVSDCSAPAFVVDESVNFPQSAGNSTALVTIDLPLGYDWSCVTAQDELHTLTARADVPDPAGAADYSAEFSTANSNVLIQGDLYDDTDLYGYDFVDIVDFGVYIHEWGATYTDADTSCSSVLTQHADMDGDLSVDATDYGFITTHYLETGEQDCCSGKSFADPKSAGPRTSISIAEAEELGLRYFRKLDMNRDRIFDETDMQYIIEHGMQLPKPQPTPQPGSWGSMSATSNIERSKK